MTTDTPTRIARLVARREKLTNRRDGRLNLPALDEIDAQLSELSPAGADNKVDLLLGRLCAVVETLERYGASLSPAERARLDALTDERSGIVEHDDATAGAWK